MKKADLENDLVIGERGFITHGMIPLVRSNGNVIGLFAERKYAERYKTTEVMFQACSSALAYMTDQNGISYEQALAHLRAALVLYAKGGKEDGE